MMQKKKYDIFISYRRDGGEVTARILRDRLTERGYNVFFDVESLRSGAFNTKLYSVIDECTDFILILSPNALDRCINHDDWVRREIEYALEKGKNVIPILLRNFSFPDNLPITLKDLPYQNGLVANLEYFDAFLAKLESFLTTKKHFRQSFSDFSRSVKLLPILLVVIAILVLAAFGIKWMKKYPRTAAQVNLTESVITNVSYHLTYLDLLAGAHEDMLHAANDCLLTGEKDICASRFSVCSNTFNEIDLAAANPSDALLERMQDSPFSVEDLQAMHAMLSSFRDESMTTMSYMEYLVSDECALSQSEKLETVELYTQYLNETTQWFAYCTNEMLLPITNAKHLETFWKETLPYLGSIPLNAAEWNQDKDALVEAGNECFENMQDIQSELRGILGDSTMALRNDQAKIHQDLIDAGYTEARAEKIVSYMSTDWSAESKEIYMEQGYSEAEAESLALEEVERRQQELEMILTFSARITDDMNTIWEKMVVLFDLRLFEEAEECILLYQSQMPNSDRYMPALILFMQLLEQGQLDHGIMVMEYHEEDGVNDQLMIGDIIYQFNNVPCKTVDEYLSMKEDLVSDNYTLKVLRLDNDYQIQMLEITLPVDSPRVYLNNLTPVS